MSLYNLAKENHHKTLSVFEYGCRRSAGRFNGFFISTFLGLLKK
jgi:hypothetical protein